MLFRSHCANRLRKAGFEPKIISAGSTPTAVFAESWEGVTEVRCGVYCLFDLVMAGLKVCTIDQIALSLLVWCYVFAELYVLQGRKVCCEAANGRNEKKVQQRRPPPAADTGRSCWGSGQQDTSAAQGTKWTLGTATRSEEHTSELQSRE